MAVNGDCTDETYLRSTNNPTLMAKASGARNVAQAPGIWIGYTKNRRSYLDKQPKALNTEQQMLALREYYLERFAFIERLIARWIKCQKPIIQIGELNVVSPPTSPLTIS